MKNRNNTEMPITRRSLMALLMSGILVPYLGFGNNPAQSGKRQQEDDERYQHFLKADGTVVRVKRKAARRARVLKKNVTNKSLLAWLNKT